MPTPMENIGIPLDAEAGQPKATTAPTTTATTPISFADLLFDSILMQQARTKGELQQHAHGLARIDITYIVDAFKVAISTCYLDQTIATVSTAPRYGQVLENSRLDQIDRVRSYIVQRKGSNGIFPKNMISFPEEKVLEHLLIPIAGAATTASFEDAFANTASRLDMEMIALAIYQIRIHFGEAIKPRELDHKLNQALFVFSPRYFTLRAQNKRERDQPNIPHESSSGKRYSQKDIQSVVNKFAMDMKDLQMVNYSATKPTFGLQGQLDLPTVLVTDRVFDAVTTATDALFKAHAPSDRYRALRSDLIKRLQKILDKTFPGCQLHIEAFGSYASGLGSDTSDADLCITRDKFDRYARYNDLRIIAKALRSGGMTKLQPILHARVPIVKFMDPFSKINCDVNCNHVLGVHNSELIRCYAMIDPRVKPLIYNVKALVKAHRINDSSQGTLSSYAYVMMILGFLQAQEPPILPSLQEQPKERLTELFVQLNHEGRGGKDLIDCSFDHDIDRYRNFGAANTKSVGQLLIEFFEFYCRYFDYRTLEVNVRLGGYRVQREVLRRRTLGRKELLPGQGEKKLIVMDPFILDRNVAGSCSRHLPQVWRTFQWLYYQLSLGHHQQAFAPIPESYFLFEMELRAHTQKQANQQQGASASSSKTTITKATVSASKKQEEPISDKKPDQPKAHTKHEPRNAPKHSQKDLTDDSDDSDDDGDEDGQNLGHSTSKSKKRRVRKADKYRRRLEAAISEAVQQGEDPSRFDTLLSKAPPSLLNRDKSNNNDSNGDHASEAGPIREFIRAVAAAVRDSNLKLPPLDPNEPRDTTTSTSKNTTAAKQKEKHPVFKTSQKEKKQQRRQSAQVTKTGTQDKGASSSSRPLPTQGSKGKPWQPKDQKKKPHSDQKSRDETQFPVLAKTRNVLPQPPASE
ncbi:hypothetical protein BGZ59_003449 [Podila verticillata]|nr:hypothetical protein BGZ59_003449 [Podila verticillata]